MKKSNSATSKTDKAPVDKLAYNTRPRHMLHGRGIKIINIQYPGHSESPTVLASFFAVSWWKAWRKWTAHDCLVDKEGVFMSELSQVDSIMALFRIQILSICVSVCDPLLCHEWCACNKNIIIRNRTVSYAIVRYSMIMNQVCHKLISSLTVCYLYIKYILISLVDKAVRRYVETMGKNTLSRTRPELCGSAQPPILCLFRTSSSSSSSSSPSSSSSSAAAASWSFSNSYPLMFKSRACSRIQGEDVFS